MDRITGPADPLPSRVLFGGIGLFLFVTGVRTVIRQDFDRPSDDEDIPS